MAKYDVNENIEKAFRDFSSLPNKRSLVVLLGDDKQAYCTVVGDAKDVLAMVHAVMREKTVVTPILLGEAKCVEFELARAHCDRSEPATAVEHDEDAKRMVG